MTSNEDEELITGVFEAYERNLLTRFLEWYDPYDDGNEWAVDAFMKEQK